MTNETKKHDGYPIDTTPVLVDLLEVANMDASAMFMIGAAYGEEQERGPTMIGLGDDNERVTGTTLMTVIETFKQAYMDQPSEAQWIAEDLRNAADLLDSYTVEASMCKHCGELYSKEVTDHCGQCGEFE